MSEQYERRFLVKIVTLLDHFYSYLSLLCLPITEIFENVALNKAVYGYGMHKDLLVDGDKTYPCNLDAVPQPYVIVDLEAVYNLQTIKLYAHDREEYGRFSAKLI